MLHAIGAVASLAALIVTDHEFTLSNPAMSLADWGDTVGTVLSSAMIVVGVAALRGSRLAAYHWFKRAVLVSIFLIQFFAFYTEQLGALVGLTLDLVLLGGLNYLIEQEETARWQGPAGPLAAPSATSASPTPVGATPDRASD